MLICKDDMSLGSTETWSLKSRHGKEYEVNIGFPRDWSSRALTPSQEIPIMYGFETELQRTGMPLYN